MSTGSRQPAWGRKMNTINWRACDVFPVHGDAQERSLVGPSDLDKNLCPKPPGIARAEGIAFFNRAVLPKLGFLEEHIGEYEEVYYVMRGSGIFYCDGESSPCEEGDAIYVPAGVRHGMRNSGKLPIEYIVLGTFCSG